MNIARCDAMIIAAGAAGARTMASAGPAAVQARLPLMALVEDRAATRTAADA